MRKNEWIIPEEILRCKAEVMFDYKVDLVGRGDFSCFLDWRSNFGFQSVSQNHYDPSMILRIRENTLVLIQNHEFTSYFQFVFCASTKLHLVSSKYLCFWTEMSSYIPLPDISKINLFLISFRYLYFQSLRNCFFWGYYPNCARSVELPLMLKHCCVTAEILKLSCPSCLHDLCTKPL